MFATDFFQEPLWELFQPFLSTDKLPWLWLDLIEALIDSLREAADPMHEGPLQSVGEMVFVDPSAKIGPFVTIEGPAFIGPGCEIRSGALLRPGVVLGPSCLVGNSCEIKNSILLSAVQVPHFNYVGDSILGAKSHLGAGSILANLRLDQRTIRVRSANSRLETGRRKLGAIVGDGCQVGCNAVLQPGTLLRPRTFVYSGVCFGGSSEEGQLISQSNIYAK